MKEKLGLSFSNIKELHDIIDNDLPTRAEWKYTGITLDGYNLIEPSILWYRSIKECIQALIGGKEFKDLLQYTPEQHYPDEESASGDDREECQIFTEMWTGRWWWRKQNLFPGKTIVPMIFSSDKTQLTLFSGDKTAYPIYLTIGNIPGHLRRMPSMHTQILVGYLPVSKAMQIKNKEERARYHWAMFHAAVGVIMKDIEAAVASGGWDLGCADGDVRSCMPLLACYAADYPEQNLVTCSNGCSKCLVPDDQLGKNLKFPPRSHSDTLRHIATALSKPTIKQTKAYLTQHRVKPVLLPFWRGLDDQVTDIHQSLTADTLHQLWQGVIKYLTAWSISLLGKVEFDHRARCIPLAHGARHFPDGVSKLSQMSGREHKEVARLLLGCIQDAPKLSKRDRIHASAAARGLLDFAYTAEFSQHNGETLGYLKAALDMFHKHKDVFVRCKVQGNMNFPKLHSLQHYIESIQEFGTVSNYSTEATERLHIDFSKNLYRATNHRDVFSQMTVGLTRLEKIQTHQKYLAYSQWEEACDDARLASKPLPEHPFKNLVKPLRKNTKNRVHLSKEPAKGNSNVALKYATSSRQFNMPDFEPAIKNFIHRNTTKNAEYNLDNPPSSPSSPPLPFESIDIWQKVSFHYHSSSGYPSPKGPLYNTVHCEPLTIGPGPDGKDKQYPGRQDMCLLKDPTEGAYGAAGWSTIFSLLHPLMWPHVNPVAFRVARLICVFGVPQHAEQPIFGNSPPEELAYVELFTKTGKPPPFHHGFHEVSPAFVLDKDQNPTERKLAAIVRVSDIHRGCQIIPKFTGPVTRRWTADNVFRVCPVFYLNNYLDAECFYLLY